MIQNPYMRVHESEVDAMRIRIKKQKEYLFDVLVMYTKQLFLHKECEVILNGDKQISEVIDVWIQKEGKNPYIFVKTKRETKKGEKEEVLKAMLVDTAYIQYEGSCLYIESDIYDLVIELKHKN